jgi:hypothetical protein
MLRVTYSIPLDGHKPIEGVVVGRDYDKVVQLAKVQLTPYIIENTPRWQRPFVKAFLKKATPIKFAQEVVSRYNKQTGEECPKPLNCQWFVQGWCVPKGFAKVEKIIQEGEEVVSNVE